MMDPKNRELQFLGKIVKGANTRHQAACVVLYTVEFTVFAGQKKRDLIASAPGAHHKCSPPSGLMHATEIRRLAHGC
ncbi:hypothetical protein VTK26DRAFT_132 [Humicola hyalothermophila]